MNDFLLFDIVQISNGKRPEFNPEVFCYQVLRHACSVEVRYSNAIWETGDKMLLGLIWKKPELRKHFRGLYVPHCRPKIGFDAKQNYLNI